MIDTLHFNIPVSDDRIESIYKDAVKNNTLIKENTFRRYNMQDGITAFHVKFDNLQIFVSSRGKLSVKGSISKFIFHGNAGIPTRQECIDGIKFLSESLGVDLKDAKLTRIDLGINLPVKHSVSTYTGNFGDLRGAARLEQPDGGLYYKSNKYTFAFYDKSKEVESKNPDDPILNYSPVIRFEIRILKDVKGMLPLSKGTVDEILKKEVWDILVNFLIEKYFAIERKNSLKYDLEDIGITTPKDVKNVSAVIGINDPSFRTDLIREIARRKGNGEITANQASRMKRTVRILTTADGLTEQSEIFDDLDISFLKACDMLKDDSYNPQDGPDFLRAVSF